jgi:ribosomal protein S18 acetylase RimI-like enzyme
VVGRIWGAPPVVYELRKFEQDRRQIYIYIYLAVCATDQGKRVATTLVGELKRIAKERDAYVVFVQSDVAAIRLYELVGRRQTARIISIIRLIDLCARESTVDDQASCKKKRSLASANTNGELGSLA